MARNFTDKYYFREDEITAVDVDPVPEKSKISVYEVVRIIEGRPLFLEDHMERLQRSLHSLGLQTSSLKSGDFRVKIASLCAENNKYNGNIEILVTAGNKNTFRTYIGFIPHKYPKDRDYQQGVRVDIIEAERENPNTKVKNTDVRLAANSFLAQSNCFEVLLKNRNDQISEGSRSNFFFFKGETLFSPPVAAVLPGVTRKYVFVAAERIGIKIYEAFLIVDQIKNVDAAFLSGTSLGVLPISHIGNHELNPMHNQLRKLMKTFQGLVKDRSSRDSA
ncbi:MAG: aminotransferase class IV [Desulforhopalus sp.]